jgi:hypothetical protein
LKLPHTLGYMLPTAAVMSAARRVENFHLFLATQPSPRQARPRANTGPPLPNLWRPAPLAGLLPLSRTTAPQGEDGRQRRSQSVTPPTLPHRTASAGEGSTLWGQGEGGGRSDVDARKRERGQAIGGGWAREGEGGGELEFFWGGGGSESAAGRGVGVAGSWLTLAGEANRCKAREYQVCVCGGGFIISDCRRVYV